MAVAHHDGQIAGPAAQSHEAGPQGVDEVAHGSGGLLLLLRRGIRHRSQEHARVLQLDARRNAPLNPVLHPLHAARALVVAQEFGDFRRPAEVPDEF